MYQQEICAIFLASTIGSLFACCLYVELCDFYEAHSKAGKERKRIREEELRLQQEYIDMVKNDPNWYGDAKQVTPTKEAPRIEE